MYMYMYMCMSCTVIWVCTVVIDDSIVEMLLHVIGVLYVHCTCMYIVHVHTHMYMLYNTVFRYTCMYCIIQWNLSQWTPLKYGHTLCVHYGYACTVEPLYSRHHWDHSKCPEVSLFQGLIYTH